MADAVAPVRSVHGFVADEARTFLATLFDGVPGAIEVRAIVPNRSVRRGFFGCWPGQPDLESALARIQAEAAAGRNTFVGVATRDGDGGSKKHIIGTRCLWVDVDTFEALEALDGKLAQLPRHAMRVCSGRGSHVYWKLREALVFESESDRQRFEDVLRGLCDVIGGDRAATDSTRVLRVPGTLNHKTDPPRPCELVELNRDAVHDLSDFDPLAERGRALRANGGGGAVHYDPPPEGNDLPTNVEELAGRHRRVNLLLRSPAADLDGYESPSEVDLGLASRLAQLGVEGGVIEQTLRWRRAHVDPKRKDDQYFVRTVEKALAARRDSSHQTHNRVHDVTGFEHDLSPEMVPRVVVGANLSDTGHAIRFAALHR